MVRKVNVNVFFAVCLVDVLMAFPCRAARPLVSIADFGVREGDKVTEAIEAAMVCCEKAGGGCVFVPPGTWLTGAVRLRSNCELRLADCATLEFSDDPADYPEVMTTWEGTEQKRLSPLIYAANVTNVAITGRGVLTARMAGWARRWREKGARPHFIQFFRVKGVRLEDVTICNSPAWMIHLYRSSDCRIAGVSGCAVWHNNDGVDVEMSHDVLIENCRFDQGDDGVAFKSGKGEAARRNGRPTENVTVRNCWFGRCHGMAAIGSELSGGIRNIRFSGCTVENCGAMVRIKTSPERGGYVENIEVRNCRGTKMHRVFDIMADYRSNPDPASQAIYHTPIRNVLIDGIDAKDCQFVYRLHCDEACPPENVVVRNVRVGTRHRTTDEVYHFPVPETLEGVRLGPDGSEWQDHRRLSQGRLPPRAWFGCFPDVESAKAILPERSPRHMSLDSETAWRFCWSRRPSERPVGFEKPAYDISSWPVVKVPCSWQAMGIRASSERFGTPIYVNQPYIFTSMFPADATCWPKVTGLPTEKDWTFGPDDNPVGSYRREVVLSEEDMKGGDWFLQFDGVESFFYLWVNGSYVGFSKNSRSPAAFDVTPLLHAGSNTIAVEVYRNSDGSYLECQDIFRLAGIFRSVSLTRRPVARLVDVAFTTKPCAKGVYDGDWALDLSVKAAKSADVKARLFAADGRETPVAVGRTVIRRPRLWSAEEPNLYTLVVSAEKDGRVQEAAGFQVGFREVEIRDAADQRDRTFLFNGQPVKLNGVNRGETDPMYGHHVPRARLEEDIRIIKRGNFNHIRNSHFPQEGYYYYLCNKYGICVMDEANLESHGTKYGPESISHEKSWRAAHVERQASMYEWNKNFPCIVIWSMGNEAGPGDNFKACYDYLKAKDPTRPVQYERNPWLTDMGSRQYPSVEWTQRCAAGDLTLRDAIQTNRPIRYPYHINEYAHNFNNNCGNLADFQAAIESSPRIMGGALWDYADQSLWMMWKGRRVAAWGGCFGEQPEEGQGILDGIVTGDRRPEPVYEEARHVFQPFAARLEGEEIALVSKRFFRDSADCAIRWTLLVDGLAVEKGAFDVVLKPRETRRVALPACARDARTQTGEVALRVAFVQKAAEGVLPKDWIVAADQVALGGVAQAPAAPAGRLAYRFSDETGELVSLTRDGKELLKSPMTLDCFRVPVGGETFYRIDGQHFGRKRVWDGLRVMKPAKKRLDERTLANGGREVTSVVAYRGTRKEDIRLWGHVNEFQIEDLGPLPADAPGVEVTSVWTIAPTGEAHVRSTFRPTGRPTEFARMGWRFVFAAPRTDVDYFACGPYDNYSDRKTCCFPARYRGDSTAFGFAYTTSLENGTREEARFVTLSDVGVSFVAPSARRFAFAVSSYSPTEILSTPHPECLPAASKTEFGLYARVRGLGSNNCGPQPLARDIIAAGETCELEFDIR